MGGRASAVRLVPGTWSQKLPSRASCWAPKYDARLGWGVASDGWHHVPHVFPGALGAGLCPSVSTTAPAGERVRVTEDTELRSGADLILFSRGDSDSVSPGGFQR